MRGFGDTPGELRIDPRAVPAGQTLLLTATGLQGTDGVMTSFGAWLVDEVPACLPPSVIVIPAGSPFPTDLPTGTPSGEVTPTPTPVPSES
ncbi:hypothetical protein [Kitasatospora cineracea]|uniref:hypothetical protein n=2 Tax=Kitasatospora cineracea TaxID=88074 RepID=UPI0037F35CD3